MTNIEQFLHDNKKHLFLRMGVLSLVVAMALARLNIYLGTQVNYLDYLSFFNALALTMLACEGIAIGLSIAGLRRVRFRSIPLVLICLALFAFLILLFLMG